MKLILASGSPRRRELMSLVYPEFTVAVARGEEITTEKQPHKAVMQLALHKAEEVAGNFPDCVVIGCDTVVVFRDKILGKPHSEQQAFEMLKDLSGNTHEVFTGVALVYNDVKCCFYDRSEVTFYQLDEQRISRYMATGSCMDKAGAYGIQDSGFVSGISGSYYNIVGLPVELLKVKLKEFVRQNRLPMKKEGI